MCIRDSDTDWDGFQWIDVNNADQSVIVFLRKSRDGDFILTILNFKPDFYPEYRVGVPEQGLYEEIFNSDSKCYGGSGQVNNGLIEAETIPYHGQAYSVSYTHLDVYKRQVVGDTFARI